MTVSMDFPRQSLGFFPTPLAELKNLSRHLGGPQIYIKRDDLTGLALGGNKTRKLEFLIAEALASGCDTVVTGGAGQSNHCRQTAAAAAACGLECHLMLGGSPPDDVNGNLLLDVLCGAKIHWTGAFRKGEKIPELVEELSSSGKRPCVIPYGGSNVTGALGYVEAVRELVEQCSNLDLTFTDIVFASSSGGTQSGLVVGTHLFNQPWRVTGIAIDKDESAGLPFPEQVYKLTCDTAARFLPAPSISDSDIILRHEYLGEGYGVIGELEKEAIHLLAAYEGILLDPVYSGRAFGALVDMVRKHEFAKTDKVLFWHTGGAPALFSYASSLGSLNRDGEKTL